MWRAGLPVIVTSVGNIPSVINNGNNAIIVPPKSPLQLKNAIDRVCGDPELRIDLGQAAHGFGRVNFSLERAVD